MTTLAHADVSLPPAASGRGTQHRTEWPKVLPCEHFSSLHVIGEAGQAIRWRGDGVALTWNIPPHGKNEPIVVVPLRDFPAGALHTAESTGQKGFDLALYCSDGHDEQLALTFSCFPSTCVTAAAYPAPLAIWPLYDKGRVIVSGSALRLR